jgi:hypothetical protein
MSLGFIPRSSRSRTSAEGGIRPPRRIYDRGELGNQVGIRILDSRMVAGFVEARGNDNRIPRGLPRGSFICAAYVVVCSGKARKILFVRRFLRDDKRIARIVVFSEADFIEEILHRVSNRVSFRKER